MKRPKVIDIREENGVTVRRFEPRAARGSSSLTDWSRMRSQWFDTAWREPTAREKIPASQADMYLELSKCWHGGVIYEIEEDAPIAVKVETAE